MGIFVFSSLLPCFQFPPLTGPLRPQNEHQSSAKYQLSPHPPHSPPKARHVHSRPALSIPFQTCLFSWAPHLGDGPQSLLTSLNCYPPPHSLHTQSLPNPGKPHSGWPLRAHEVSHQPSPPSPHSILYSLNSALLSSHARLSSGRTSTEQFQGPEPPSEHRTAPSSQ